MAAACIVILVLAATGWILYRHVRAQVASRKGERSLVSFGESRNSAGIAADDLGMAIPMSMEETAHAPILEQPAPAAAVKRPGGSASAAKSRRPSVDLSAYKIQPRQASKEDYLPVDESMTTAQVKNSINGRGGEGEDWGEGWIGDVMRGAQNIVKKVDDTTLDASRKALGDVASPDKATVRPGSDGVLLHINIPTK